MNATAIEWTGFTWNANSGCEKVSAGCKYCYAETIAETKRGAAFPNGFGLTLRPHKLREPFSLRAPARVFVNSMSDLFWDKIPPDYLDRIVDVIEAAPWHEFQVLTKRPERMLEYSRRRKLPPNFWAGTTVESRDFLGRLDVLRQVDAQVRFVSAEPLLSSLAGADWSGIHWVITGGESGKHLSKPKVREQRALVEHVGPGRWELRADRAVWLREIRDAVKAAGGAYFHKQHGGIMPKSGGAELDGRAWKEYPLELGTMIPDEGSRARIWKALSARWAAPVTQGSLGLPVLDAGVQLIDRARNEAEEKERALRASDR